MFAPSHLTGRIARVGMSNHLAGSLGNIAHQISATSLNLASIVRACARQVESGARVPPLAFCQYFQMVDAIEEDRVDDAVNAALDIQRLLATENKPSLTIYPMSKVGLGEKRYALVNGAFADEFFGEAFLKEIDAGLFASREAAISSALGRMKSDVPELFSELSETIDEIILAEGGKTVNDYTFDGASSLIYWGAIALNASLPKTELRLIEALSHEAAHNTLFGLSPYDHFVFNEDSERYASPLREDLRPLDGIYHATFVLARMHYAISRVAESPSATSEEREEAATLVQSYKSNFYAGHSVLQKHAAYTSNGAVIMAQAAHYMALNS